VHKSSRVKTNRNVEMVEIHAKFKLSIAKLTIYY
jgi:hypothetical protein